MSMPQPDIIQAHKHSIRHRNEILASEQCGCFFCSSIFKPAAIDQWVDTQDGIGQTAMCPNCGIDSVMGSQSGYPITLPFLAAMHRHWFGIEGSMDHAFLRTLLKNAEGHTLHFTFTDGVSLKACVTSSTHIYENDTVLLDELAATGIKAWQVHLKEIRKVEDSAGSMLFVRN